MRIGTIVRIAWLLIGTIAGGQRHWYKSATTTCAKAGTITVTILAGPLNYISVNPKITCPAPTPST